MLFKFEHSLSYSEVKRLHDEVFYAPTVYDLDRLLFECPFNALWAELERWRLIAQDKLEPNERMKIGLPWAPVRAKKKSRGFIRLKEFIKVGLKLVVSKNLTSR